MIPIDIISYAIMLPKADTYYKVWNLRASNDHFRKAIR
jgi:hypothetical protein